MKRLLLIFLIATLWRPEALFSQWVCIGKDGKPCTAEDVDTMVCKPEKAPPNLSVAYPVRLAGTLIDSNGALVNFDSVRSDYQSIIQIRNAESGEIIFAVPLRKNSEFEFESVPAGSYRLIAIWMHNGKFERLPLADQPTQMTCGNEKECRIVATIRFHGTDDPIDSCPPK